MKKISKLIIAVLITISLLVACGGDKPAGSKSAKIGVASLQKVAEKKDDDDTVIFDIVVAGVALVDDKVAYVSIDFSEQFAKEDDDKIMIEALPTKKQRNKDYGLLGASQTTGLGKEWFEQIAGIEENLIGKTLEEVKEYFAGEEIKSSATIYVGDFEQIVVKAIEGAVEVKDVAKVGLGYNVFLSTTNDDTKVSSVLDYAMVAVDSDGKIIKALLDSAEEKAELEGDDWKLINVNQTKGELKEAYGMVVASGIGEEWYKQTESLMEHLSGKTLSDVTNLNDDPTQDDDLKTSVTYNLTGFKAALAHANDNLVSLD